MHSQSKLYFLSVFCLFQLSLIIDVCFAIDPLRLVLKNHNST